METAEIQTLIQLGFSIIPVKTGEKRSAERWKPFQENHPTADQISGWKTQGYVNFAIVTGAISDVIVIDIDSASAYQEILKLGFPENMPIVSTGKGYHLYFAYPKDVANTLKSRGITGHPIKTCTELGGIVGLDIRADGGYVLAPGAIHPSGKVYKWHIEPKDGYDRFPQIPVWLRELLLKTPINNEKKSQTKVEDSETGAVPEGGRNVFLHKVASSLRARGRTRREILERLKSENERCQPPLPEDELAQIANSAAKYEPEIGDYTLTEHGASRRMLDMFGDEIRFSIEHGKWLLWNESSWKIDDPENIYQKAISTSVAFFDDSDKASDPKIAKKLHSFAMGLQSYRSLNAVINITKKNKEVSISGEKLDSNPWILNCPNGMIDLRNWKKRIDGEGFTQHDANLLPHDRNEFCTKISGVEYLPEAECPRWLTFLDEITDGDYSLQSYLQRIVGYSLTGDTSEHVWFMLLGHGRNGKSTFLNTIQNVLGDYASNIRPEALLMQGMDRVPNDLAALKGARFTAASETPASRKLNESLIKQLTGGDTVQARFLFKEFFEFKPQCKLFLATNYRPNIQGTDIGIWRRTHEVPFPVAISEKDADPNLSNKLDEELAGILAWAVRGCIEWQRQRLNPPQAVQSARTAYYKEMDIVGQFIEDWCTLHPVTNKGKDSLAATSYRDLYAAFAAWAFSNSEELLTKKAFGMKLSQRGILPMRMPNNDRGRIGIELRAVEVAVGRGTRWMVEGVPQENKASFL